MANIEVKTLGVEEYKNALKEIEKTLPQETIKKLNEKAVEFEKIVKSDIESKGLVKSGKLKKSFKHKDPIKMGKEFSVTVDSKARHVHLVNDGHNLVTHRPLKRKIGYVKGYNFVEDSRDKMNVNYTRDIRQWVFNLIETKMR